MTWLTTLIPFILELLKIFFGGAPSSEKEKAAEEIRASLARIRAALDKAVDGDTSAIEDEINGKG